MSERIQTTELKRTPLHSLHADAGGRMVAFAGYDMPVQYRDGILAEHRWTRAKAGLFDVSHMGQAALIGDDHATVAAALEALTPGDFANLAPGAMRYTLLLNDEGGILDDLMVTRPTDRDGELHIVVNAATKDGDFAYIADRLPGNVRLETYPERALLALQGPSAHAASEALFPAASGLTFMTAGRAEIGGVAVAVSRSGYTGEDGFEISMPAEAARDVAAVLLTHADVALIGLGARDSLRLEAGLCLYGHDINPSTSPVEAALTWAIAKRRRDVGGFPGFERIKAELTDGPARKRVGFRVKGQGIPREGAMAFAGDRQVGVVTSGGFGPSVDGAVAMGYVETALAKPDTALEIELRGRRLAAVVTRMPFVEHRYRRA